MGLYLNLENMELRVGFTILIDKFKNGKEKEIYWLILKMCKKIICFLIQLRIE